MFGGGDAGVGRVEREWVCVGVNVEIVFVIVVLIFYILWGRRMEGVKNGSCFFRDFRF